jgi:hypothetical protein
MYDSIWVRRSDVLLKPGVVVICQRRTTNNIANPAAADVRLPVCVP